MAIIGLRDLHYAVLSSDNSSGVVYGTPVKIVGAISANVNPNTSSATLFADDGPYDSSSTLGEISLELNVADLPATVSAALLGHTYSGGLLVRKSTDQPPYVAIGYRSMKSNGAYRYTWLYKGKFTDGEQANNTKGDSIEYQTPTITGAFVKRDYDDAWQTEADSDDTNVPAATLTNWFAGVINPSGSAVTLASIAITTAPTKVTYAVGETFDPAGMKVTATFSDSTTAVIPNSALAFTPAGALASSDTSVTITYVLGRVAKTATQSITVA